MNLFSTVLQYIFVLLLLWSVESMMKQMGDMNWGKCTKTGVLLRLFEVSILQCLRECRRTSNCFSINYRYKWHICDLVGETNLDFKPTTDSPTWSINHLSPEQGCVNTKISTWPEVRLIWLCTC